MLLRQPEVSRELIPWESGRNLAEKVPKDVSPRVNDLGLRANSQVRVSAPRSGGLERAQGLGQVPNHWLPDLGPHWAGFHLGRLLEPRQLAIVRRAPGDNDRAPRY